MDLARLLRSRLVLVCVIACGCEDDGTSEQMDGSSTGDPTTTTTGTTGTTSGGVTSLGTGEVTTFLPDTETTGTTGGSTDEALEAVADACEADCAVRYALECAPTQVNQITCELQCVSVTNQLGEFCLGEYANLVNCRAEGGYECVNDNPTQLSTCASQQQDYYACTVDLGCKRYCARARDEGCGGPSLDLCIEECIGGRADYPENCSYYYDGWRSCQAYADSECVEGELSTPAQCDYQVSNLAACISDESMDLCTGWCWAAKTLGCDNGCDTACPTEMADPDCGQLYTDAVDCGLFFEDLACGESQLEAVSICESDWAAYITCKNGG